MFMLFVFAAQIDWTAWGVIIPAIVVVLGFIGFIWRILTSRIESKASKDELAKLEKDMEAKINRVEKRNTREHDLIRKETVQILQPMREQLQVIFNHLIGEDEK